MPQKTWVIGEEVLAADFNNYVQTQVVARFATVAARDAAWPAATAGAGAVCVTIDTGTLWQVFGGVWLATASLTTAWTAVTFQNSWTNTGGVNTGTNYRKVGDNVQLRLACSSGGSGTVAFTLPTGFRPQLTIAVAADGAGGHARVMVAADGTVTLLGSAPILSTFMFSTL